MRLTSRPMTDAGACFPRRAALYAACAAFALVMGAGQAQAGDWRTTFGLSQQTSYESNPELGQGSRRSNTLNELTPSVLGAYETDTYSLDLDLSGTLVRSRNQTVTGDATRLDLNASNDFDFDRVRFFNDAVLSRDSVENTEFNDNELTTDAASASVTNDETVEELTLSSRLEWDFTDRVILFGTHQRRDVRFDGGTGDSFVNNEFSAGGTVLVNDRLQLGPSVGFSRFEPDDEDRTRLLRADLNGSYQINDNALASVSVGILDFESQQDIGLNASYQHSFEKTILTLGLSREVSPGDNSALETSDTATLGVSYEISDRTQASFDAQYRETETVEAQQAGLSLVHIFSDDVSVGIDLDWTETTDVDSAVESVTDQYRADPFVAWQINEDINARLSYRELQERQTDLETVRSRRVTFSISYSKQYD